MLICVSVSNIVAMKCGEETFEWFQNIQSQRCERFKATIC